MLLIVGLRHTIGFALKSQSQSVQFISPIALKYVIGRRVRYSLVNSIDCKADLDTTNTGSMTLWENINFTLFVLKERKQFEKFHNGRSTFQKHKCGFAFHVWGGGWLGGGEVMHEVAALLRERRARGPS